MALTPLELEEKNYALLNAQLLVLPISPPPFGYSCHGVGGWGGGLEASPKEKGNLDNIPLQVFRPENFKDPGLPSHRRL